jgi:hypothetical protein
LFCKDYLSSSLEHLVGFLSWLLQWLFFQLSSCFSCRNRRRNLDEIFWWRFVQPALKQNFSWKKFK